MRQKVQTEITLAEHNRLIASKGGAARAKALSKTELSSIGRNAGKISGKARAAKLTQEQRSDIARKAAAARWGQKNSKDS